MSRFNTPTKRVATGGPIKTQPESTIRTANNAPGFARDVLSELFLLGVSNFYGQDTFYERAKQRDDRYIQLIRQAVAIDADWVSRYLNWLRNTANMRTASLVGAVEAAKEKARLGIGGGRLDINAVLQRADEPGEMVAYYMAKHSRNLPMPIKRGIADAVKRLYTPFSTLKYDTDSHNFRFGDVIELCHPHPGNAEQRLLFPYLLARGHKREPLDIPDELPMLVANAAIRIQARTRPQVLLNSARLRMAGMTWEDALSLVGSDKSIKKQLWEALIPTMGYAALLRNLRNFDECGIGNEACEQVKAKLTSPAEVAQSRQLPMRFLSAVRNAPSARWAWPLEQALDLSLQSVPSLPGRTLILIDTSSSMRDWVSANSELLRWDAAVLFGLALAARAQDADVVSFSTRTAQFPLIKGETVLKAITRWKDRGFFHGGGTDTVRAVAHFRGHDQLVVLTDEQANLHDRYDVFASVPKSTQVITFNLAGYAAAHAASTPTRVTIGGLSDSAFSLLPVLGEFGRGQWPF